MRAAPLITEFVLPSDQEIALELLTQYAERLPRIVFGMRDARFRERRLTKATPQAAMQSRAGYILDKNNLFTAVLTLDGIFRCPYVLSEPEEADFLRSKGLDPLPLLYPDWQRRETSPDLWLKYHDRILAILTGLRSKKRRTASTSKKR